MLDAPTLVVAGLYVQSDWRLSGGYYTVGNADTLGGETHLAYSCTARSLRSEQLSDTPPQSGR